MKTREARLSISILDYVSYIEKELGANKDDRIIQTPFSYLNKMLGGGLRGLTCLGAAPGLGKSAMAQQIAIYSAIKNSIPVVYVDLEHSIEFLTLRFLSSITSMTIETVKERIRSKTLTLSPMLKLLTILPGGKIVTEDIIESINSLVWENAMAFVIIDSIQKLPIIPGTTPRESANIWIREIEYIKNNFPVVMMVISELSRGEGGKNYTYPSLGSLKESGDLEYTFEQVLLLSQISGSDMYRINLVKNRFGPSGEVRSAIYSQENFRCWHWDEIPVGEG